MTAWHLWVVCVGAAVALVVGTIGLACWGIWTADARGFVSLILFFCCFPVVALVGLWAEEDMPQRPVRLSKQERDRLREEKRRIHVDAEIRRMEQEAGL